MEGGARSSAKWFRIRLRTMFFLVLCLGGTLAGYRAGHRLGYQRGSELVRVEYPVKDLVLPLEPAVPAVAGSKPSQSLPPTSNRPATAPTMAPSARGADFESLVEIITTTIQPETWQQAGGDGFVRTVDSSLSLVVLQTRANHARIADLLEGLRRNNRDRSSTSSR